MEKRSSEQADPIRVLLVDDHRVVRSGLGSFLLVFDDLLFVGEASNGQEAIEACAELQPDVVLMDLMMPVMDGIAATQAIRTRWPGIQVLALTSYQEDDLVQGVMRAGAIGYLTKNITADQLAAAIRSAMAGQPTLSPEAAQALRMSDYQVLAGDHVELTRREKEVVSLMARGLSNLEIADRLVVSRSTVKFHVSSLLTKLGAATRTEAVAIALNNHLVEPV
jgi:two-component system, NarL family, response regulator LiaR